MRQKARELAEWIDKRNNFLVVYNHDADGISSGAIIGQALKRKIKFLLSRNLNTFVAL